MNPSLTGDEFAGERPVDVDVGDRPAVRGRRDMRPGHEVGRELGRILQHDGLADTDVRDLAFDVKHVTDQPRGVDECAPRSHHAERGIDIQVFEGFEDDRRPLLRGVLHGEALRHRAHRAIHGEQGEKRRRGSRRGRTIVE
jgi:hypothetical protein